MAETTDRPDQPPLGSDEPGRAPSRGLSAKVRTRYSTTRAQAETRWHRIEESRDRVPRVDIAFQVYERDREISGPLIAGAVAFRLFLWLIPYTVVLVVAVGFFSDLGTKTPDAVARDAGLSGYLAATVAQATTDSSNARWFLLVVGLWALLLASRSLTKALRASFALAWGVRPERGRMSRLTLVIGGSLIAMTFASSLVAGLRARSSGPGLWIMLLMVVLFTLGWTWVCGRLPHAEVPWTALLPGGIVVGIGTQVLYLVSVLWYVPHAASLSKEYGSLGVAILLLGWLFIIARLMVGSAVFNAVLWTRRTQAVEPALVPTESPEPPRPE